MGHMVGSGGRIVGVDHLEELVSMAATNIGSDPGSKSLLESGVLQLHTCDGRQGIKGNNSNLKRIEAFYF